MTDDKIAKFGLRVNGTGDVWEVYLPHMCDQWQIAGDQYAALRGVPHAEALANLEAFATEVLEALDALRARQFFGYPEDAGGITAEAIRARVTAMLDGDGPTCGC